MVLNIFTDGASRGNPGHSGAGVAIYQDKVLLDTISLYLGKKTNNEAEYLALIAALEFVKEHKLNGKINIFADSQLLVKQMKGEYKVKAPTIIPLFGRVNGLVFGLDIKYYWIRREENMVADSLANKAIDDRGNFI